MILSDKVAYKMVIRDNRMHTPAHERLPWFPFHLDVILSPRDPGTTSLELAEPRAANFSGFCQVSFQRMCGDAKAPALISPDTDSKQRDGRQGEAVGMRRGSGPSFLLSCYIQILMLRCGKERGDVNNPDCLQDAASNLSMIKLI